MTDQCAEIFHSIMLHHAGFNIETDAFIMPLAQCAQKFREKASTKAVRNCTPILERVLCQEQFKMIGALGYDVARQIFGHGSNVPRTLIGTSMCYARKVQKVVGSTVAESHDVVEVFIFDDPALIKEDLEATDYSGRPRDETRWQDRLAAQAKKFKVFRERILNGASKKA